MSIIRADSIKNRVGDGAPNFPNGITVTGVVTATTLNQNVAGNLTVSGNASIGGVLTYEDVKNVDSVGVVTARNGLKVTGGTSFFAGAIAAAGAITGTASTATLAATATNVTVSDESSDTSCYPVFVTTNTGNLPPKVGTNLTFNSSSGQLTATSFSGDGSNLTGITQTTINNNANNKIITGSGTANTLEAESGLTYDGTTLQVGAASDIRIAGGTWTGEYSGGIKIQADGSNSYFQFKDNLYFRNTSGQNKIHIDQSGNLVPAVNNDQDIGSSSYRWRNLYMQDLQLSNLAQKDTGGNDVDGTWGDYTIQEGESDLFLINNRNGKKYKFMLKEVD